MYNTVAIGFFPVIVVRAGMVELADTIDLGSIGKPWGFKSLYPHQYGCSYRIGFCKNAFLMKMVAIQLARDAMQDAP